METVSHFHDFTSQLPEAAAYDLRECLKPREFVKGEIIFHGGDSPDHLFQLASGSIALVNYSASGQEIMLTQYRSGDWFGMTGIMDRRPRINTAIALEDTRVLVLASADFHHQCDKHPQILRAFSVLQANHNRLLLNLLVDASLLRLPARIVRTIQRLHTGQGMQDADGLHYIKCSHDELSRYVGASRQSTSIELKKLEQEGILRSAYGKIYIENQQALDDSCDQLTSFEPVAPIYSDKD
jgi:CRP/FNR family cyclic AMP-dependent transcriptional regulator